ncbi:mutator type transposase [Tanacetum coccineum]
MNLNQDLFQQDNVVDTEDYTDMVDGLQQRNEDVVFSNIDQENKDVEVETVDEIDASDESKFEQDETPLIRPHVDMNDFHFDADAHIDHVTSLASDMVEEWDINGIDFDEFDSGEDHVAAKIMNKKRKKVKKYDIKRVTTYCYGFVVGYGKGKHTDDDGYKDERREILDLDGAFIKRPYIGQILTNVGVDSNNEVYPLAYAIGILPVIAQLFLAVEHICCVRHIYDNMKQLSRGRIFKDLIWKCATTSTVVQFNQAIEEIKALNLKDHDWLQKIPPPSWSNKLVDGKDQPIIGYLEYIREYLIKRIVSVHQLIDRCGGPLTPTTHGTFRIIKQEENEYNVIWNGGTHTNLTGMSCKHVVTVIFNMESHGKEVGIPQGRPRKKRRMQKDEIAEQVLKKLVKGGKMSMKGTIVSCGRCGEKGHNRRGCASPTNILVKGKKKGNGSRNEGVRDEVLGTISQ